MERCVSCKTGRLVKSGSHLFCDKCSFSVFIVTDQYISACSIVLSELVSNTKFSSRKDVGRAILDHIEMHLPQLDYYMSSVVSGKPEVLASIMEVVEAQAINLQIGKDILNKEEAEQQLVCGCGAQNFKIIQVGELECVYCQSSYHYDETEGIYVPDFLCSCGNTKYDSEEGTNLVRCHSCGIGYLHNQVAKTFTPLFGGTVKQ